MNDYFPDSTSLLRWPPWCVIWERRDCAHASGGRTSHLQAFPHVSSHSGLQELMLMILSILLASAPVFDCASVWQSCRCTHLCIACKWPCRQRMTSSKFLLMGKHCFGKSHVWSSFVSSDKGCCLPFFFFVGTQHPLLDRAAFFLLGWPSERDCCSVRRFPVPCSWSCPTIRCCLTPRRLVCSLSQF